jgi:hypothetical protein
MGLAYYDLFLFKNKMEEFLKERKPFEKQSSK